MSITKIFNFQSYTKITSISILGLTLFIQSCNNNELASNMKYEKQEEEMRLKDQEKIESTSNTNKPSIFSYLQNAYNKLNPFAKNIPPKSRVILGCGQQLNTHKHNHKGYWTVAPDETIKPDYLGYAEDALASLDDNSCESILSEYLPLTAFTHNLFRLVSQKLNKEKKFTIFGNPDVMIGKNKSLLISDFKNNTIKTIDFTKEFDGENIKRDNHTGEIGNTYLDKLLDELEDTDKIEDSLKKFNLQTKSEENFESYFLENYNLKLSEKVITPYRSKDLRQALLTNQTNPSIKNLCKIIYYAYLGNCSSKPKLVFIKI